MVTVAMSYEAREVRLTDLAFEPDPNLVELCERHADRLTPPRGWMITDERSSEPAAEVGTLLPPAGTHPPL